MTLPLWNHQRQAIEKAGNRFALFFDPGCGKSRTVIEIYKKQPGNPRKAIIFAPLNVCRNWQNELKEYLDLPYRVYLCAGQTKLKKIKTLQDFAKDFSVLENIILICNIEALRSGEYRELMSMSRADFVTLDESHNFKTPNSLQTKGLFHLLDSLKPEYLYLLTGTPAPQGDIDLWSTFRLLGKTKDSFFLWRRKHFVDKNERRRGQRNYWPEYVVTPAAKEQFKKTLEECSLSANKNEVLDLPELIRTSLYTEMSPAQKRHYETMKEYLFAIDEKGNELNASNFLARTLRLQQILAGFLGDVPIAGCSRLDVLRDAIDLTAGKQFLVWTIFKPTYDAIAKKLEGLGIKNYGFLTGEQTAEERYDFINAFQAGDLRALICNPKAGGVGVNLTAASFSIHYTRGFSLTDDLQAEARNYRGGSEIHERITRIDIVTENSIDEEIVKALKEKKSVQDFILGVRNGRRKEQRAA